MTKTIDDVRCLLATLQKEKESLEEVFVETGVCTSPNISQKEKQTDVVSDAVDAYFDDSPCQKIAPTEVLPAEQNDLPEIDEEEIDNIADTREDVKFARANAKDIIDKSFDALDSLLSFAKDSESPRAFEVVSKMIESILNANHQLVEIHKISKEIQSKYDQEAFLKNQQNAAPTNQTNNLFVGTTSELLELLKEQK